MYVCLYFSLVLLRHNKRKWRVLFCSASPTSTFSLRTQEEVSPSSYVVSSVYMKSYVYIYTHISYIRELKPLIFERATLTDCLFRSRWRNPPSASFPAGSRAFRQVELAPVKRGDRTSHTAAATVQMPMKRRGHACLLACSMGSLVLLMMVLYGPLGPQPGSSSLRQDYQLRGRPLYKLDLGWPRNPELFTGDVFAVAVDQHAGVVYVAQRGDNVPKVLLFTTEGDFLMSWNTTTLEMPHGIFLADAASSNPTVWITDVGNGPYGHCIKQYTPSGKLLQVLGTPGKAGSTLNPLQFDQPAEIFIHSSGEMYIVDGDGGMNNRLIKLSKDLEVLWMHGEKGRGLAQFYIPHSVTVDNALRVWVADRGNKRIQVFNSNTGDWLGTWGSCFTKDAPYSVRLTPDRKYFVVVQLNTNQISLLDAPPVGLIGQCKVVSVIQLADEVKPHLVDLDLKTGALYVAEIGAQQAQKFTPFSLEFPVELHLA